MVQGNLKVLHYDLICKCEYNKNEKEMRYKDPKMFFNRKRSYKKKKY